MRVRIVHLTPRSPGTYVRREDRREVDGLGIGRGTDSDVALDDLAVELHHSRVTGTGGDIRIVALECGELMVNGRWRAEHRLRPGDSVRVGRYELRVIEPTPDEDLALEIEPVVQLGDELTRLRDRTRVGVQHAPVGPRALAWTAALGVIGAFLLLPLGAGVLESSWNAGEVARAHAFIAESCEDCHAVGFQRVRDDECLACHEDIGAHAQADGAATLLAEVRCASCHLEHNGSRGLAALEQELCSDCHGDLTRHAGDTGVRDVSDFARGHPEFRLSIVQAAGGEPGAERVVNREVWGPDLREESGLEFTHAGHVGLVTETRPGGLDCGACHRIDPSGLHMEPLEFERDCRDCHALRFDEERDAVAPHEDADELRRALLAYYVLDHYRALERDAVRAAPGLTRRMPGAGSPSARRRATENARASAARAEAFLMSEEDRGPCALCHVALEDTAGFKLAPVRVAPKWMPRGEFSHRTHRWFRCRECHAPAAVYSAGDLPQEQEPPGWADAGARPYGLLTPEELRDRGLEPSRSSEDVLIPGRDACTGCHGGGSAAPPLVASECVLCHPFHRAEHGRLRAEGAE